MNKRINIIYILTIVGIVVFCGLAGYWLCQQYMGYLRAEAVDLYGEIVEVADTTVARQIRRELSDIHGVYRVSNVTKGDTTKYSGYIVLLDKERDMGEEALKNLTDSIDNGLIPPHVEGICSFGDIDVTDANTKDFQEAMNRMLVYNKAPFVPDTLIENLQARLGLRFQAALSQEEANRIWNAKLTMPRSIFNTKMEVLYPYNPINGGAVVITADVPAGYTLRNMAATLCAALAVAAMLIACLVLQIKTIRRQQKIADFQKNYTLTMLHELKRPIGALKIFISFMRNPRLGDSDRQQALENGAKEVDNLASCFDKLRAITYSDAYDAPLSLSAFDLVDLARECVADTQAEVNLHANGECLVTAERQGIANVLANLVENAVKYSPAGAPIDIDIAKRDDSVVISVSDRGRGIPDAEKSKIFDRFYRAEGSKDMPGIGLGLAYVKQVVDAHGGQISVRGRKGGGSVFTIVLPQ